MTIVFLGFLYIRTLARGLTWAYDGADGGDLVTAAVTGGVPHPTGYPTYLLLSSAFLKLPFGSFAYRTNLLSTVCTIAAALAIYATTLAATHSELPAVTAALAFGTFPLVWSQAIITEVNALHALFVALILYLLIAAPRQPLADVMTGLITGLGLGNHLSTVLLLPLLGMAHAPDPNPSGEKAAGIGRRKFLRTVGGRLAGLSAGLAVYLIIPLRAAGRSPVNWGDAVDWNGFVWLVSGKMYWNRLSDINSGYLWTGIQAWSHFMLSQLGPLGLLLVFVAISMLFRRSRLYLATAWLALANSLFAVLYFSPDSYVYLVPVLIAFSMWIGLGAWWLVENLPQRLAPARPLAIAGLLALFAVPAIRAIPAMNLSGDRQAEDFAGSILRETPQGAVLLVHGDEATFALWYFHYAYRQRPDVVLISGDLLAQRWYRSVLKDTYPGLIDAANPDLQDLLHPNSGRPFCLIPAGLEPRLECTEPHTDFEPFRIDT